MSLILLENKHLWQCHGGALADAALSSVKSLASKRSIANLSCSVLNGTANSSARFLRRASSDVLKAAPDPKFFAISSPNLAFRFGSCRPVIQDAKKVLRVRARFGRFDELTFSDESPSERLSDGLLKLFLWHPVGRNVQQGAQGRGHAKSSTILYVGWSERRLVKNAPGEWFLPKFQRDGQMDLAWKEFRKVVDDQGRLVGHDGLRLVLPVATPKGQPHEVIMFARREAPYPVEPMFDPLEIA